jgi:predicted RNase H-like HicB family nuclease
VSSRYEIIIYWSTVDNAYLAELPELARCMADGASYQEALANAQIVIDDWIETAIQTRRFIPEPKGRLAYA